MRKRKDMILAAAGAFLIVIFSVMYIMFVSSRIHEESTSHLQEIYLQVDKNFSALVSRNWTLLAEWGEYVQYVVSKGEEEKLLDHLASGRERRGYTDFYFLDDDGDYITLEGERGYLNFGHQLEVLMEDRENVVVDGTLPQGQVLTVFAAPVEPGVYNGFAYSAIALSYENFDMQRILDVSAFSGQMECHVVYPDGRVLLSTQIAVPLNYLSYLEGESDLSESEMLRVRSDMKSGQAGEECVTIDGQRYYMVYQPVDFQNWMLVGVVPQSIVNANMNQVQWVSMGILSAIFLVIVVTVLILVMRRNHRNLRNKEQELKYRDQLFGVLVENTANIFAMFSPGELRVEYISPNVERLLGLSADEVREDMQVLSGTALDQKENLTQERMSSIPLGGYYQAERRRIHQRTGEERWYQETLYHMSIEGIEKYILVMEDRTKEKKDREQLNLALDIARGANEAKSSFLSNMSHDIRTPMNAIVGFASLLSRDASQPEKVREYTDKIRSASRHLLNLINDVLDMSKIESGKTTLHLSEFEMEDMLQEVATVIRPQAKARKQQFDVEVTGLSRKRFVGDKTRISQILLNLLSNAVKYTQEGGQIGLFLCQEEQLSRGHIRLRFEVRDNGIGMSKEFQQSVFDPFTREYNSTTSGIQGTGLGMAITRNLVELMGGTISVESSPGEGTVFTLKLELRCCEEQDQISDIPAKEAETECVTLEGMRFLVAEDNEINAEILTELLAMEGASCEIAVNGKEALSRFERSASGYYDAVLMDIQMPVMDGYGAARAIRASAHPDAASIVIAAMTANAFAEDVQKVLAVGMDAHIAKPIDMEALKKTIVRLCRHKALA